MDSNTITIKQQLAPWILTTLREALWAPLTLFIVYRIGLAFHVYDIYPRLDILIHFFGGLTITFLYRSAIHHAQKIVGGIPFPVQVLFAFTCTGTTVVLWEFYEYLMDVFFHTQMMFGLTDTLRDMLMGLLGALVFSLFYRRKNSDQ